MPLSASANRRRQRLAAKLRAAAIHAAGIAAGHTAAGIDEYSMLQFLHQVAPQASIKVSKAHERERPSAPQTKSNVSGLADAIIVAGDKLSYSLDALVEEIRIDKLTFATQCVLSPTVPCNVAVDVPMFSNGVNDCRTALRVDAPAFVPAFQPPDVWWDCVAETNVEIKQHENINSSADGDGEFDVEEVERLRSCFSTLAYAEKRQRHFLPAMDCPPPPPPLQVVHVGHIGIQCDMDYVGISRDTGLSNSSTVVLEPDLVLESVPLCLDEIAAASVTHDVNGLEPNMLGDLNTQCDGPSLCLRGDVYDVVATDSVPTKKWKRRMLDYISSLPLAPQDGDSCLENFGSKELHDSQDVRHDDSANQWTSNLHRRETNPAAASSCGLSYSHGTLAALVDHNWNPSRTKATRRSRRKCDSAAVLRCRHARCQAPVPSLCFTRHCDLHCISSLCLYHKNAIGTKRSIEDESDS